jgi:hypothetical protein
MERAKSGDECIFERNFCNAFVRAIDGRNGGNGREQYFITVRGETLNVRHCWHL